MMPTRNIVLTDNQVTPVARLVGSGRRQDAIGGIDSVDS